MKSMRRRELLHAFLGTAVAGRALAGCKRQAPPPTIEGSLRGADMKRGHGLRDGAWHDPELYRTAKPEQVRVAIVGGGPAGLAAAWQLAGRKVDGVRVLELEGEAGGTSRSGSSAVTPFPWGAHYLPVPMEHNEPLIRLLGEAGALDGRDAHGVPRGSETALVRQPEERIFYQGYWYQGSYLAAGSSDDDRAQIQRFSAIIDRYAGLRDARGRRAFALPSPLSSDDPELLALDGLSAAQWLAREGFSSERLRRWVDYACRDDYGLGLSHTSAWAALFYFAARRRAPGDDSMPLLTWPDGNGTLVRHLRKGRESQLATGKVVVDVTPREGGVRLSIFDTQKQRGELLDAERVIVAVPRFVAARIVAPLRGKPLGDAFHYGAWMVANLQLRSRPGGRGYPPCWDNLLYDSPSLGYVCATHQRGRDHGPTVWTYYLPMTDGEAAAGRRRLLQPSWGEWKEIVLTDIGQAHPDIAQHVARVDIWRWGHGMAQPRPGVITSGVRRSAAAPVDRIHFAHSDLSGLALFEEAFHHGVRAADEVAKALGSPMG